jgi:hypothetical protein
MPRLRQHLTTRPHRALAVLAAVPLAVATAVAATAVPVSAGSMDVRFKIDVAPNRLQYPDARAVIPMGQYEVWGYLNNGAHARVQLFGDDPVSDDLLLTTRWAYLGPSVDGVYITGTNEGIVVTWRQQVARAILDEDPLDEDEIYVKVTVIDGDGRVLAQANSNVVRSYYVY